MTTEVRSLNEQIAHFVEHNRTFPKTDLDNPLYNDKHIIEADNKVYGFGCLKLTAEAILVVDNNLDLLNRARTVRELIQQAIFKGQQRGLDELHAFLTGPNAAEFRLFLKRRFGFEDIIGTPMVLRLK